MEFEDPGITIDKEWLLSRITEEEVFEHYTGVPVGSVGHFRSPLRKDKHPTCSYRYGADGRPRFKDWASDRSYDCIDLVQTLHNIGYRGAIEQIASDFNLITQEVDNEKVQLHRERYARRDKLGYKEPGTRIEVATKGFIPDTLDYFAQFGIGRGTLDEYYVKQISKLWVNDHPVYWGNEADPAVGYYLGVIDGLEQWKIYFYTRDQKRFICNTRRLQGWFQLPEKGDRVIITKSLKDVMTLHELGEAAIAPQGETVRIRGPLIEALQSRFDHVYSLYDWDLTGVAAANRLRKEFNIPALFTHEYGTKDISDLVQAKGMWFVADLIENYENRPL